MCIFSSGANEITLTNRNLKIGPWNHQTHPHLRDMLRSEEKTYPPIRYMTRPATTCSISVRGGNISRNRNSRGCKKIDGMVTELPSLNPEAGSFLFFCLFVCLFFPLLGDLSKVDYINVSKTF